MSDQSPDTKPPPSPITDATGLVAQIGALFSPATFAAIRYALTAVGTLLAMFGLTALSSAQIDHVVEVLKQVGTTVAAIMTMVGIITPVAMAMIGYMRSTIKSQIESVRAIAQDKTVTPPLAKDAQQALVSATISLDGVQTIVADKELAQNNPSASVVSKEDVAVVTKK